MRTALVIPDGVGVRNFLQDEFIEALGSPISVLHAQRSGAFKQLEERYPGRIQFRKIPDVKDCISPFILRQALAYAHMTWADTKAMRYVRGLRAGGSWRSVLANRTARLLGRLAASRYGIHLLEQAYYRAVNDLQEMQEYRELLQDIKPDVLFSTSHRASKVTPAILAARSLGIPTAAFVASWDNITGKSCVCAPFDRYLVWSNLMRQDLLRFYPKIPAESIHVVGSPQFDCYANSQILWSREEFFRRIGGNPSRPLICYSGGDSLTSPEDPQFVRLLAEQVREKRMLGDAQILVRPCPVDQAGRYDAVRRAHPELLFAQPAWKDTGDGTSGGFVPLPDDTRFLANLTFHAALNVNVASTMTLDFNIRDKPVVNVAFDATRPPIRGVPVWDLFYQWEHYRPVVDLQAARFARSPEEMPEHINAYLKNPNLDAKGRRALVELQISVPIGEACQRVADSLKGIASLQPEGQSLVAV